MILLPWLRQYWKPLTIGLAALLLLSAAVLGSRAYQRRQLAGQQAKASQANAEAQAAAARRYRTYQMDSTARATERRQLLENARTQHKRNEALSHFRPALIDLPEHPPRP